MHIQEGVNVGNPALWESCFVIGNQDILGLQFARVDEPLSHFQRLFIPKFKVIPQPFKRGLPDCIHFCQVQVLKISSVVLTAKLVISKDQVSTFHLPLLWHLEQLCHKVTKNKPLLPAEKDYTYIARNLLLRCSRVMTILQKYVVSRYSYIDDKICLFPAFCRLLRACLRQLVSPGAFSLGCQQN